MGCEEFQHQVNARTDGELAEEDAVRLEAHLAECAACRAAAEGVQTIDAELRRAFAARGETAARLADGALAAFRASQEDVVPAAPEVVRVRGLAWGQALLAAAAGFLLAVAMLRSRLLSLPRAGAEVNE